MKVQQLVCFSCVHFRDDKGGCDAFPQGIPDTITSGFNTHKKPLKDQDNKIVYKKKNPGD